MLILTSTTTWSKYIFYIVLPTCTVSTAFILSLLKMAEKEGISSDPLKVMPIPTTNVPYVPTPTYDKSCAAVPNDFFLTDKIFVYEII